MKKVVLLLTFLVLNINVLYAQSLQSTNLYAEGVDLYSASNYAEALKRFSDAYALDTVEINPANEGLRHSCSQWIASCHYKTNNIAEARKYEELTYDLPPVDRRTTAVCDSLSFETFKLFQADKLEEALAMMQQVAAMEEKVLGGETWYSLNTRANTAYLLSFLGHFDDAEQAVLAALAASDRLYGTGRPFRARLLAILSDVYLQAGDIDKLDATYVQLFQQIRLTGLLATDFPERYLQYAQNMYLQTGNAMRLDEVTDLFRQSVGQRFGATSSQMCYFLINTIQMYIRIKNYDKALALIAEGEVMASETNGRNNSEYVLLHLQRGVLYAGQGDMDAARKVMRESLKICRKLDDPQAVAGVLSFMLMSDVIGGRKLDEGLLADVMDLMKSLEETSAGSLTYASAANTVALALMSAGRTSEAAAIVNKNMGLFEELGQFSQLFTASLILLQDRQFVNARKASSRGMEILNRSLSFKHAMADVIESQQNIINGMKAVDSWLQQEGFMAEDTTTYSLNMIRQDLLQARLAILSHTDSLGTAPFMTALGNYARTAYLKTKDTVMGDSIVGMYTRRLADTFGSESPQYAEAIDLKERCRFEDTIDGHSKAFRITLATPGTERYEQLCREYEEAYAEWKGEGGKRPSSLKADDYFVYVIPRTSEIQKSRNYQTVADSCQWAINRIDDMLKARKLERDEKPSIDYLRDLMAVWALCADSLGRSSEVVPQVQSWYRLISGHGIWDSKSNLLQMLATAKISGDAEDYARLEASVADTIRDGREELHAATLLQSLYQMCNILGVYSSIYNNTLRRSLLTERDKTLERLKSADNNTYTKYLMLRTGLVARNSWRFGGTVSNNKESLIAMLETLERDTSLHVFSESHVVASLLCREFYSFHDYALVVRADRLRKKIAKACDADRERRQNELSLSFQLNWATFSPLGKDFKLHAIYTNLEYGDADELEEHVQLAYSLQNEKSEVTATEQQEVLLAQWDGIRSQQRNAFADDENLVKKIEDMTTQACQYLERQDVSDTICGLAYNIALFGKGYLLRSHQQLRHVISESGNRTVLRDLDEYIRLEQLLDNSSLSQAEAEEATTKTNDLWQKLRSASTSFDDYSKSLEADWHDVRNALASDELAIEYVCANSYLKQYFALILRKDYEAPLVKRLFFESTYTENPDTMFTREGRYRSPWPYYVDVDGKSIHPFEGIRRVYVSPTGVLHKLPLESLPDLYTDSIMSDKFEIYRVTSTRELIDRHRQRPVIKARLYGDITYSMDGDQWQLLAATKDSGNKRLPAMRDVPKLSRAAVSEALQPLEGTEREVREIAAMLGTNSDDVTCCTGADATEDNLKSLSGSGVTVLHIATHGFYQTTDEAKDSLSVTFARSSDKQEANALSRSGLFMAGAAAVFSGDPIPNNVDDGVLTAREISHLDLTSLDMLALSACETALGDTSGEGVFGLQRGFKKAGAQSILMSLWKVDDEATCLLMTEFYKNWVGGKKTKREALELAKQTVRSHKEKGWDDPKYWAAFILLDGLE